MARIVSLVIGRGGSSFKNKNVRLVKGFPLVQWTCAAAKRSSGISEYFVSSDCPKILQACSDVGFNKIIRPADLATNEAKSCDAVRHALEIINGASSNVDLLIVQHANVGTISEGMIDECISIMQGDPSLTAVVPSHRFDEYHPARGKLLNSDGTLSPVFSGELSPNRQQLPPCYFFDHSFWVLRGKTALSADGQPPWDCMGNKIRPYETSGCFDVHCENDLYRTEQWLIKHNIPDPK